MSPQTHKDPISRHLDLIPTWISDLTSVIAWPTPPMYVPLCPPFSVPTPSHAKPNTQLSDPARQTLLQLGQSAGKKMTPSAIHEQLLPDVRPSQPCLQNEELLLHSGQDSRRHWGLCRLIIGPTVRSQTRYGPNTSAASSPRQSLILAQDQNLQTPRQMPEALGREQVGRNGHIVLPQLLHDGARKFQNAARSVTDQGKGTCGLTGVNSRGEKTILPRTHTQIYLPSAAIWKKEDVKSFSPLHLFTLK